MRLQGESGKLLEGVYITGLRKGQAPQHANTLRAFLDIFKQEPRPSQKRFVACLGQNVQNVCEEGLFGLWRGAPANVARAALLSAGQLATYDQTKQMALAAGASEGPALHLAASCCSGLVAQAPGFSKKPVQNLSKLL